MLQTLLAVLFGPVLFALAYALQRREDRKNRRWRARQQEAGHGDEPEIRRVHGFVFAVPRTGRP